MPKAKRSQPSDQDDIEQTPDITENMSEVDLDAHKAKIEKAEDLRWLAEDPPNFFTCPSDRSVLKLRGIFKYMHHSGVLSTGEHWECPDCGYVCWRYLPPAEVPAEFTDGFPF